MIITVASGKGGTGKTTIAANLALVRGNNMQFLDCDVEEPNAHLFLKPNRSSQEKVNIPVPEVDENKCDYCGYCAEICEFNAITVVKGSVLTFPELCHGCGGCSYFCPRGAIKELPREIGVIEKGKVSGFAFYHGRLNPGEAMAPPVINELKRRIDPGKLALMDAPPGTSCPVVASVKGSDYCLLVTEPTPFGLNDLKLAAGMLKLLKTPAGVVINRCDIGSNCVKEYCKEEGLPVLMELPWDRELARLYAKGELIVKHSSSWREDFIKLWKKILSEIEAVSQGKRG